ncbi:MAG: type IV pilus twitching motility protein PilT [Opitutales bacterium]
MNNEILWLVRLGLDQNLFTRAQANAVRAALGDSADLMDYAQKLIDDAIVADVETLEKVAGLALTKGKTGRPADDPFAPDEGEEAPAAPEPRRGTAAPMQAEDQAHGPAPKFPFEQVEAMDDASLAAGMRQLLRATAQHSASDLHLSTGARPFIRKHRSFTFISDHVLTAEESLRLNTALISQGQRRIYHERKDYDYALALSASDRYRVNLMFHKEGAAGSYRMVPAVIKTLESLGFASHLATLEKLLSFHNGLILVTGPVGSGKTTTLSSMVAYLNESREDHIITVEDPIEVVHLPKGCNVSQREVGPHTKTFATALKGALREDPDIIVIGELRDLETIEMAITASETGHLVIATMHTSDAATTLNRLLDVFPPAQQTQVRASVAESLRGIVCQRLLPGAQGGLVLACEILVSNIAIANLIKEGKGTGLRNAMETGVRDGMCLMDNVVFGLWRESRISAEVALANISNRVLRAKVA